MAPRSRSEGPPTEDSAGASPREDLSRKKTHQKMHKYICDTSRCQGEIGIPFTCETCCLSSDTFDAANGRPRVGPFANPRRTKPFVRLNGDCSTTLLVSSDHLHELSCLEPCCSKPAGSQAATLPVEQQLHTNTGHPILSPNLLMSAARCSRRPSPVSSGHSGPKDHRRSRRWPRTA